MERNGTRKKRKNAEKDPWLLDGVSSPFFPLSYQRPWIIFWHVLNSNRPQWNKTNERIEKILSYLELAGNRISLVVLAQ